MITHGRLPGPFGLSPSVAHPPSPTPGHIPGVLGIGPGILVAQLGSVGVVTRLPMPRPYGSLDENSTTFDTKDVHILPGSLFPKAGPAVGDVRQGIIANCALASILAAHAHTASGKKHLLGMVKEISGKGVAVETDVTAGGPLANPPAGNVVASSRYFVVTLGGKTYEVSDVFYTNDGARNSWELWYMRSPTNVLWPCVIEKALAVRQGGYHKLDESSLTADDMWKVVTGNAPTKIMVSDTTSDATLLAAARAATSKATIAGSNTSATDVNRHHGFAVLGVSGGKIQVHDPGVVNQFSLTPKQFRHDFFFIMSS